MPYAGISQRPEPSEKEAHRKSAPDLSDSLRFTFIILFMFMYMCLFVCRRPGALVPIVGVRSPEVELTVNYELPVMGADI